MIELLLIFLFMLFLLLLKGFFSGSEIALINADKIKLSAKANFGHKGAKSILKLFQTPDVLLGTTLVGTNIATVALTTLGTLLMIRLFGQHGDIYAFIIFTPIFLILGEIVPKSVFQQKSEVLSLIAIYPLRLFSILFYPIIFIFSRIARFITRIIGAGKTEQNLFMEREQLRAVVDMAERTSSIDAFDHDRIRRIIRFAETTVAEAMIPIGEVTALSHKKSTRKAVSLVRQHGFNRLPVFSGNTSNIIGIVTLTTWDLMKSDIAKSKLAKLMKPALYVTPHQTIDQLLPQLQARQDHIAVVVNEFGSAIGIITMEDILEEVVGEIDVGYDFEEYLPKRKRDYEKLGEDVYLLDSRLPISKINELLFINLPIKEFHTIGGLITARLQRIPKEGEHIIESGYKFIIVKATNRAILKLRVEPGQL